MRIRVRSLASLSWLRIQHCCKLQQRSRMQLGFGVTVAVAVAPIWPLPWELPHATGVALKRKKKKSTNNKCWRRCREKEPSYIVAGKVNWCSHYRNSMEVPQKPKNRVVMWSSNPTPGHIHEENSNSKRHMGSSHCGSVETKQNGLVPMRTQVRSLASLSELRV